MRPLAIRFYVFSKMCRWPESVLLSSWSYPVPHPVSSAHSLGIRRGSLRVGVVYAVYLTLYIHWRRRLSATYRFSMAAGISLDVDCAFIKLITTEMIAS